MDAQIKNTRFPQEENEITEFKSSFGKETIETIVAMANTRGGNTGTTTEQHYTQRLQRSE